MSASSQAESLPQSVASSLILYQPNCSFLSESWEPFFFALTWVTSWWIVLGQTEFWAMRPWVAACVCVSFLHTFTHSMLVSISQSMWSGLSRGPAQDFRWLRGSRCECQGRGKAEVCSVKNLHAMVKGTATSSECSESFIYVNCLEHLISLPHAKNAVSVQLCVYKNNSFSAVSVTSCIFPAQADSYSWESLHLVWALLNWMPPRGLHRVS